MAYLERQYTVTIAAGAGVVTITVPTRTRVWTVAQISTDMPTAPAGASCYLRKDGYVVTPMIPTGDVAGGDPPVQLRAGERLTIEWANCTNGDVAQVLLIGDEDRT